MKILFVNTIAGTTAIGSICDSIIERLCDEHEQVYMASAYGRTKIRGVNEIKIGNFPDRMVHAMMTRLNDSHGLWSKRPTATLLKRILDIKPDVVHLHNLHGYYLDVRLLLTFLKNASIPVIVTFHDFWLMTGHCYNPLYSNCDRYKEGLCGECPQTSSYPISYKDNSSRNVKIKKSLFDEFDNVRFVAVSKWSAKFIENSWIGNHPLFMIYNGVDTEIFNIDRSIDKKRMVLAVANVWTQDKGIDSYRKLRGFLPDDVEMTMIGLSKSQIKSMPSNINCVGKITSSELSHYYNSAMVTINMSRGETFGMTMIESMACGTPVITFDNTSAQELITPDTGILVENGNIEAMAEAIKRYRGTLSGEDCRTHVLEHFDKRIMADNYLKLYRSLI